MINNPNNPKLYKEL